MKIIRICILIIFLNTFINANTEKKQKTYSMKYGITNNSPMLAKFKDANFALKIWLEKLGNLYNSNLEVEFFDSSEVLFKEFKKNNIDVMVLDLPFFFKNREEVEKHSSEKWGLSIDNEKKTQYYLLGNSSKNLKGFSDFKNRTLSIRKDDVLAETWFKKSFYEKSKLDSKKILKRINKEKNDRRVLLNVFFGKTDYSVITKKAWEDMLSFNPSIKNKVEILGKSEKIFIPLVGLHSKKAEKDMIDLFFKSSGDLKSLEGGKKAIDILKFNSVYRLHNSSLEKLDSYFKKYFELEKKYK